MASLSVHFGEPVGGMASSVPAAKVGLPSPP